MTLNLQYYVVYPSKTVQVFVLQKNHVGITTFMWTSIILQSVKENLKEILFSFKKKKKTHNGNFVFDFHKIKNHNENLLSLIVVKHLIKKNSQIVFF